MKIIVGFLLIFALISANFAQKKDVYSAESASERADNAVSVLKKLSELEKDSAPLEVLRRAKAVGVFSEAKRLNMVFDESFDARGVISVRRGEKWSTPLFVTFGSLGNSFKIARKKFYDIIFFVMDDKSVEKLKKGKFKPKLTPGTEVAGKDRETVLKKAAVIYYAFDDGKLLTEANGKILSGVVSLIVLDNKSNKAVYDQTGQIILTNEPDSVPVLPSAERFRQTIGELSAADN